MLPNEMRDAGFGMRDEEGQRFAVVLNDQGRFAATEVGEFMMVPEVGRHIWKGKMATSMAELADHVNGAIKSIIDFGDPFKTIEVVAVGMRDAGYGMRDEEEGGEERDRALMTEAHGMLLQVIGFSEPENSPSRRQSGARPRLRVKVAR